MAVRKLAAERSAVKPELFLSLYEKMLRTYYVEEQCQVFVRAGKCSFYASARGHEKLQIALAMLLKPGKDWFFPYYREKALMVGLGMPLRDIFLGMLLIPPVALKLAITGSGSCGITVARRHISRWDRRRR